eukprot:4888067-Lingulodinium_polyedra.AAC.1
MPGRPGAVHRLLLGLGVPPPTPARVPGGRAGPDQAPLAGAALAERLQHPTGRAGAHPPEGLPDLRAKGRPAAERRCCRAPRRLRPRALAAR